MKQSRNTEEQIISILRENETSVSLADLSRKHRVRDATVYK
jgi:putative transposase